jgi:hypothetical protein
MATYSKNFLFDIFPSLAASLSDEVLDILFPAQTQRLCPTPTSTLDLEMLSEEPVTFRWPNLINLCLIGFSVGVLGYWTLMESRPMYARSFIFFAMMNTSALLTHCLFPTQSQMWQITYAIDMVATSTSSFFLILAVCKESMKRPLPFSSLAYNYYFLAAFSIQFFEIKELGPGYWIAEALYIGVTAVAAAVAFCGLVVPTVLGDGLLSYKSFCLSIVLLGAAIFGVSPVSDVLLCEVVGNPWGNLLTPAFLGCDIAFLGLWMFVKAEMREEEAVTKKEK